MRLLFQHKINLTFIYSVNAIMNSWFYLEQTDLNMKPNHKIHGQCVRCKAPVFLNRSDDHYGNAVMTLNCWNGHYQWINIEGVESDLPIDNKVQVSKNLVKRISFFKLS